MSQSTVGRPKDVQKQSAILDSAAKHFIERGFKGASMNAIADGAGVTKLTVYNHFGNKETLFNEVIYRKCETYLNQGLYEHLPVDSHAALVQIGRSFCGIIYNDEAIGMLRVVASESSSDNTVGKRYYEATSKSVVVGMVGFLEALQASGKWHFDDCGEAADIFFALFKGKTYSQALLGLNKQKCLDEQEALCQRNARLFARLFKV